MAVALVVMVVVVVVRLLGSIQEHAHGRKYESQAIASDYVLLTDCMRRLPCAEELPNLGAESLPYICAGFSIDY